MSMLKTSQKKGLRMNDTKRYAPDCYLKEVEFQETMLGKTGNRVKRMQEWLYANNYRLAIDGAFGPATNRALGEFASNRNLAYDKVLTPEIWLKLIEPITKATKLRTVKTTLDKEVLATARKYCPQAKEIGGNNMGPWVRFFMKGNQGTRWPWCAGFISTILAQASASMGMKPIFKYSFSTSRIMKDAMPQHRRFAFKSIDPKKVYIFCLKGGPTGYKHIGIAHSFKGETFETIEGNTNIAGSADGDSVMKRYRNVHKSDFIDLTLED